MKKWILPRIADFMIYEKNESANKMRKRCFYKYKRTGKKQIIDIFKIGQRYL